MDAGGLAADLRVLAAATILRLPTIVAREVAPNDVAVVTVASVRAGTADNVIPDRVELRLNVRTFTEVVPRPGPVTGSEDVGVLARAADAPCVYRLLGGADPVVFAGLDPDDVAAVAARVEGQPSNHSPMFAPVIEPTLSVGVRALVAAARTDDTHHGERHRPWSLSTRPAHGHYGQETNGHRCEGGTP